MLERLGAPAHNFVDFCHPSVFSAFILHLRDEVRSHLLFSNCLHHFQQDIYALIHLFRNSMFIIAMVGIAAGAQVGAGKAPEGELGAVRSPANRSGDRRQSDSTDS